jgi:hypothetical protein
MQDTWRQLLRSVLADAATETAQANVTDAEVARYVERLVAGEEPEQASPELHQLFLQHPALQEEIDELVAMFTADQSAQIVEPVTEPAYSLSFLQRATSQPAPPSFPPAGIAALASGVNWAMDQLGQFWIDLSQTLPPFTNQPALVTRGGNQDLARKGQTLPYLSLGPEELGNLDIEVEAVGENAGENAADGEMCTLRVTARIPTRWPAQDGTQVTILYDGNERSALTDENGEVRFENFPLQAWPRTHLRVIPATGHSS